MPENTLTIAATAAGGLALFLLAMGMMTDGLKVAGGRKLKVLLAEWTSSPLRGVFSGALVTAFVQSSSAVTVATIGFVNAGILTLRQALGVVFGANLGTTMTGWLVSVTGIGFRIEGVALPLLAVGVALRMLARSSRMRGLGDAIAGFGLFFLGLAILKDAFAGLSDSLGAVSYAGTSTTFYLLVYVGIGFAATLVTQSSSAAIALALTAATQGVIGIEGAAAAVIGANVGTTSTALFAVVNATPNAKRVAMGHLAFNVVTAMIALAMLPLFLAAVTAWGELLGFGDQAAPLLALFHTAFNLLGVVLLLPFTTVLARRLSRLFRTTDEDLGKPRHLDQNVLATPALALAALRKELERLLELVGTLLGHALRGEGAESARRQSAAIFALGNTASEFATSIRMEQLSRRDAEELPRLLRIARYLQESARLAPETDTVRQRVADVSDARASPPLKHFVEAAERCVTLLAAPAGTAEERSETAASLRAVQRAYQAAKSAALDAAVRRTLHPDDAGPLLDALSRSRRAVEQLAKASRRLRHEAREPGDPRAAAQAAQGGHAAA